jgi:hypothetical protein
MSTCSSRLHARSANLRNQIQISTTCGSGELFTALSSASGSSEVAAQIPENLLAEDLAEYKKAVEILQAIITEIEARLAKLPHNEH